MLGRGQAIFARFWDIPMDKRYYITRLPGAKKGISSSWFNGYYLIMNKYISKEQKIATGKVIEFLLSKEIQLDFLNEHMKFSGMLEVYDDQRCNELYRHLYRSQQFVKNQQNLIGKKINFANQMKIYINEYIYNNASTIDTLKNMDLISTIYYIEYDSVIGIIVISMISVIIGCILVSILLVYTEKLSVLLHMFNKFYWTVTLLGLCICSSYGFFVLGVITPQKCVLKLFCILLSISLFFYPLLIKLIAFFPVKNKFSELARNYSNSALSVIIMIDVVFIAIFYYYSPFIITEVFVDDGMNYNKCTSNNIYYNVFLGLFLLLKFILLSLISLFTFIEWGIESIFREIRTVGMLLYIGGLFGSFLIMIEILNIEKLFAHTLLIVVITSFYSIANYLAFYWYYYYQFKIHKDILKIKRRKEIEQTRTHKPNLGAKKRSIIGKIIDLHYSGNNLFETNKDSSSEKESIEIVLYTSLITDQMTNISSERKNDTSEKTNIVNASVIEGTSEIKKISTKEDSNTVENTCVKEKTSIIEIIENKNEIENKNKIEDSNLTNEGEK